MKSVTYGGPAERSPLIKEETYEFEHGDKTYAFPEGKAVEVPEEVAKALGKPEGHTFDVASVKGE